MENYSPKIMIRNTNFISIIICSREKQISKNLTENIKNTVGCDFELIVIDNSENQYSIFEAYNLGIEKSIGEYICFIHDDILLHTQDWGTSIAHIFENDPKIGLVGVAGSKVKTKMPSAWWDCPEDQKVINIIQHFPNKEEEKWELGFEDTSNKEVVVIDGVFMAARKNDRVHFNENLKGFHNYDLNISFEYKKNGYKIIVTNEILVEHFSLGKQEQTWLQSVYEIHKLYKSTLPLEIQKSKINKSLEVTNAIKFINECLKYEKMKMALLCWIQLFYLKPVSKYHICFWKRILKNRLC